MASATASRDRVAYLWSFSNLYAKGKYVADNKFDPEVVSQQCGAGLILKSGKDSGAF